jgi:hypothetical protein
LEPAGCFLRFHWINQLDDELVNQIASGTFKCPDVKARGSGADTCQHQGGLAFRARWSIDDHGASPWIRRERDTLSHRWVPIRGGDTTIRRFGVPGVWSILLTFTDLIQRQTPQAERLRVPQISTQKPRLRPSEVLTPSAKRLLQDYLPQPDSCAATKPRGRAAALERPAGDACAIPKTVEQSRTPMVDDPSSAALHGRRVRSPSSRKHRTAGCRPQKGEVRETWRVAQ